MGEYRLGHRGLGLSLAPLPAAAPPWRAATRSAILARVTSPAAVAPAPRTIGPVRALLWSLVCPGMGEYRLGHRGLGLSLALVFFPACGWLLVAGYGSVHAAAIDAIRADPTLAAPGATPDEDTARAVRLTTALVARWTEIRAPLRLPLVVILVLYVYSMAQAYSLARRRRLTASGGPG
jgi:hypothetical protein